MRSRILFDDNTKLPSKFQADILKNSENKDDLGRYLPKKCMQFHLNQDQILVVTYEHTILSTDIYISP